MVNLKVLTNGIKELGNYMLFKLRWLMTVLLNLVDALVRVLLELYNSRNISRFVSS